MRTISLVLGFHWLAIAIALLATQGIARAKGSKHEKNPSRLKAGMNAAQAVETFRNRRVNKQASSYAPKISYRQHNKQP